MAYTVYETQSAECDIAEIIQYLVENLGNTQAAEKWLAEYEGVLKKLEEYPEMFEFSKVPGHRQRGFRRFLIGRYVVIYTIADERKKVCIYRLFHGTRDYARYL